MGGLLGGGAPKSTPLPTPAPVQPMVDTDSPEVLAAKRRAATDAQQRSGRASTLLSGSDYGDGTTLGKM